MNQKCAINTCNEYRTLSNKIMQLMLLLSLVKISNQLQENHGTADKVLEIVALQSFSVGNRQGSKNVFQIGAREGRVHMALNSSFFMPSEDCTA